jgi:hypothetical protein
METIIGVVLGWTLAVAREVATVLWRRRQAVREERETLRVLARITAAELADADRQFDGILEGTVLWKEVGFPIAPWDERRETLAKSLRVEEWDAVSRAYAQLSEINGMTAYRSEPDTLRLRNQVIASKPFIEQAQGALARVMK